MQTMPNLILAAADPAEHVVNHSAVVVDGWWIWSGHQGNLVLTGLIMVVVGLWASSKIRIGDASKGAEAYVTRNSFAHLIEVLCSYLRDEVVKPLLPDRTAKFMPFLWTIFFFILINNILGLIPILDMLHIAGVHKYWLGGTATQNVWVTGVLALIAMVVFNVAALVRLGVGGFAGHLTGGAPFPVSILLFVLEGAGQLVIKPVALTVRLAANMTAGHILLATLAMFVAQVWDMGFGLKAPITVISVAGGMAVMLLELFVAFLQAFIFMFLTTIFISLMDHHDEHGHEHEHGHADHGHEHAHA